MDQMYNLGLSSTVCRSKSCTVLLSSRTVIIKQILLETISSERKLGFKEFKGSKEEQLFPYFEQPASCAPQGMHLSLNVKVTDWIGKEQIVDKGE